MADVSLPKTSQTGTNEWADVEDNDQRLLDVINKDYDSPLAEVVGMSIDAGSTRRDKATVATEETTTSTTWADLATTTDTVTLTVPSNSMVIVGVQFEAKVSSVADPPGGYVWVGVYEATDYAISGAPERSEGLGNFGSISTAYLPGAFGATTSYTTLPFTALTLLPATAGSRTYKMKYATSAGTATFKNRTIWAVALGGF
ncbi:MAG: hypothetical protein ACYSUN_11230 [Planctomycetota bacterium]|jgi:hypothetical protein